MDTTIISNKVFKNIQPGTGYASHTGTILYANKFSGLPQVSMPDDIKKFLDSNLGSVGTNPLIQLKNKLAALPGGPWYIDCRNGMLYIHNKKFNEDVVHNYTYQAENGEVISLSFETQRRTKSLGHSRGSAIDPNTKAILGTDSNVKSSSPGPGSDKPEKKTSSGLSSNFKVTSVIDASRISDRNLRPDVEYYATSRTKVLQKKYSKDRTTTENKYNAYKSGKLSKESQFNKSVSSSSNARKDKWARNIYVNLSPQDRVDLSSMVADEWNKHHNRNSVLKLVRKYFGYGKHTLIYPVWQEQWVDPMSYTGNNTFNSRPQISTHLLKPENSPNLKYKLSQISQDPHIKILSPVQITNAGPYGKFEAYTMKVFRLSYSRGTVESAQIVTDWLIRLSNGSYSSTSGSGGSSNGGINGDTNLDLNFSDYTTGLSGNKGRTVTEKKLVVTLTVIGRPSLETSQILHIDNVGKKWSGDYYVKTCTHDLSSDMGYTCTLELNKNGEKAEIESSTTKLSTEKIVEDTSTTSTSRRASDRTSDSKKDNSYKRTYYSTQRVSTSKPKEPYKTKKARDK